MVREVRWREVVNGVSGASGVAVEWSEMVCGIGNRFKVGCSGVLMAKG